MKISIVGYGYLRAVHAACMAELGHDVLGIDVGEAKVVALSAGRASFYEPGLRELLTWVLGTGRLRLTTAPGDDLADVDLHFIAAGTPQSGTGIADLSYVDAAITTLLAGVTPRSVMVGKSTVPVGTATQLADRLAERDIALVWDPKFLREGVAVADTLHPDRIVYGLPADPARAELGRARLDEVYTRLLADGIPQIVADYAMAELVKVAADSFLATKISFINAMAELCEATGGDVTALTDAPGHDGRVGWWPLGAGVRFGGGCPSKDICTFVARAQELGAHDVVPFLREVDAINQYCRGRVVDLAPRNLGDQLSGVRITVLGAAFKPNSDDIRDSPVLDIVHRLYLPDAQMSITDPKALDAAVRWHPDLVAEPDTQKALQDTNLVLLLTEWDGYVRLDPVRVTNLVRRPVIIDGRNALNPARRRASGWTYHGLGRWIDTEAG